MIFMLSEVCFSFELYQFICRLLLSINDAPRIISLGMDQIVFIENAFSNDAAGHVALPQGSG